MMPIILCNTKFFLIPALFLLQQIYPTFIKVIIFIRGSESFFRGHLDNLVDSEKWIQKFLFGCPILIADFPVEKRQ